MTKNYNKNLTNKRKFYEANDDFDLKEFDRIKNAKKELLGRVDQETIQKIAEHTSLINFLMEDHRDQYAEL